MKRLLTLLFFAFFAITTQAQTAPDLPPGSVPFGTGLFRAPDGDIWGGSKFDQYVNLGSWERVADSLGAKINWSDTTIIASKEWVNSLPGLAPQTLSLSGENLSISGGNSVSLYGLGATSPSFPADLDSLEGAMFSAFTIGTLNRPPNATGSRGGIIQMTRLGQPSKFQLGIGNEGDIHARTLASTGWTDWKEYPDKTWVSNNYYTKTNLQTGGQAQVHWDNITNVPGGLGMQTLSLGSNAGRISISGGNSVDLASVAAPTYSGSFEDFNPNIGLWVYRSIGGSSGYPATSGGGIRFNRNLGNNSGSFDIFKAQGTSPKLYYSVGLNGPWAQYTFASEEWVNGNYVTLGTNQTITGLKTLVGGNALRIQAATDAAYISFLASDGSTRKGYIGFPSTSPNDIFINNDAGGLLKVKSGVNGLTYDYGSGDKTVWHDGNLNPSDYLKLSSASSQEVTGPVVFSGNPQVPLSPASANSAIAKGYLENTLTSYALDNSVVKLTGNQNILGDKTFEGTVWHYGNLILENEPISDKMAATKKYVDDAIINNGVQAGFGLTKDTATNTMSWGTVQTFGDETFVSVAVPSKTVLYFGDITDNTQPTLGILNSTGPDGLQGVSFFSGTVNNNLSSVQASSNADGTQTRARMASTDGVSQSTLELVPAKTTLTAEEFEVKTPSSGESGIILTAPNGSRYRVTVDNAGNLTTTLVP